MRFLKIFLMVMGGLTILVIIGLVIYVDGALFWAARLVRQEMHRAYLMTRNPQHGSKCYEVINDELEIEIGSEEQGLRGYRLRFENEKDYVIEAVCFSGEVEQVKTGTLPYGVTKVGGSGLMVLLGAEASEELDARVLLQKHFRRMETGYVEGETHWSYVNSEAWQDYGDHAAETTCEGWGYQCCLGQLEVGNGERMAESLDCPELCYESCKQRPYVVYFNTQPIMERKLRRVNINSAGAAIQFGYEVADADGMVEEVVVDFGDGEEKRLGGSGLIEHEYSCNRPECVFVAEIKARDDEGLDLAVTRLNKVEVVLRP